MQLYCYVKQLDDVRKFFKRLDVSKHVFPLRSAFELEALCLHGQVFVYFWSDAHSEIELEAHELGLSAANEGMICVEYCDYTPHVGLWNTLKDSNGEIKIP